MNIFFIAKLVTDFTELLNYPYKFEKTKVETEQEQELDDTLHIRYKEESLHDNKLFYCYLFDSNYELSKLSELIAFSADKPDFGKIIRLVSKIGGSESSIVCTHWDILTIKCELNKLNRTGVNIVDNNLQDYKKTIYILNHELSEQNLLDKIRFGYFGTQAKYCDEKLAGQIILQWDKVKSELEITRKEVNHLIEAIQQLNK